MTFTVLSCFLPVAYFSLYFEGGIFEVGDDAAVKTRVRGDWLGSPGFS